jgi:hypothetical protein
MRVEKPDASKRVIAPIPDSPLVTILKSRPHLYVRPILHQDVYQHPSYTTSMEPGMVITKASELDPQCPEKLHVVGSALHWQLSEVHGIANPESLNQRLGNSACICRAVCAGKLSLCVSPLGVK